MRRSRSVSRHCVSGAVGLCIWAVASVGCLAVADLDNDGFVARDCHPGNPDIYPGAPDAPYDGVDSDCGGDEFEYDADRDGHNGLGPGGGADCDERDSAVHPDALEVCDGIDNNCNGLRDEADPDLAGGWLLYLDRDGDGFGNPDQPDVFCSATLSGYVDNRDDCDDTEEQIGANAKICYPDEDGDGDGAVDGKPIQGCDCPSGFVDTHNDCDDNQPAAYWGAVEVCDGIDNNCNDATDEEDPTLDPTTRITWYFDDDGDNYGITDVAVFDCVAPPDHVRHSGDCDDDDPSINPGAVELPYDGVDNDCQGGDLVDIDGDGVDGIGGGGTDCNDDNALAFPGAIDDTVDGIDQNCDHLDGKGFFDDFDDGLELSDTSDTGLEASGTWRDVTEAFVTSESSWSFPLSFEFGHGASAETVPLDTTRCDAVTWTYQGRLGESHPSLADALVVEYTDGEQWYPVDTLRGTDPYEDSYTLRMGAIFDTSAFSDAFALRFVNTRWGSFNVDDLRFGCSVHDNDGDGIAATLDCNDDDDLHWTDCEHCVDIDGDGRGELCDLGWDCDETDPARYSGALELPGDGVDSDCDEFDGTGLFDDFESGYLRPAIWASTSGVVQVQTLFRMGEYSLELWGESSATTAPLNTSDCSGIVWSYYGWRHLPEAGEWLTLEYWAQTRWVEAHAWEGFGQGDVVWSQHIGIIEDTEALSSDFQIRLTNSAIGEEFYVEDLVVGCADEDADGDYFPDLLDCDDSSAAHWTDCLVCEDVDLDGFGEQCDLGLDCNDLDHTIHPLAAEIPGDGFDQDCNPVNGWGIVDDFEDGLTNALWNASSADAHATTYQSATGVVALAVDLGSEITTVPVNLEGCDSAVWGFLGKRGPSSPDPGDVLWLEYQSGLAWLPLYAWEGDGTDDLEWTQHTGVVADPVVLTSSFRARLSGEGSGGTFYVDNFVLGCNVDDDVDDDGVPPPLDCADVDGAHWMDCLQCLDDDLDDYGAGCDLGDDCDDANPDIHPDATEVAGDAVDQTCDGLYLSGVFDDFESGPVPVPQRWESLSGDATIVEDDASGDGTFALRVGGGGVATLVPVDTDACDSVFWSYQGRRGPPNPERSDVLELEYWDGAAWVEANTWAGAVQGDETWFQRTGVIYDEEALSPGFQARFSVFGLPLVDEFYLDDVMVGCGGDDGDGDGILDIVDCDDTDPDRWSDCTP